MRACTVLNALVLTLHATLLQDHPLAIGEGQTISAPHMHAICLELLEPHLQPGARVLDVGAGAHTHYVLL
jgi:protein-L-isoaspartate O-methyltransferase